MTKEKTIKHHLGLFFKIERGGREEYLSYSTIEGPRDGTAEDRGEPQLFRFVSRIFEITAISTRRPRASEAKEALHSVLTPDMTRRVFLDLFCRRCPFYLGGLSEVPHKQVDFAEYRLKERLKKVGSLGTVDVCTGPFINPFDPDQRKLIFLTCYVEGVQPQNEQEDKSACGVFEHLRGPQGSRRGI